MFYNNDVTFNDSWMVKEAHHIMFYDTLLYYISSDIIILKFIGE